MNLLALFLYELNYGFGDSIKTPDNNFFVYNFPSNYNAGKNFGDIRITKGQYEFKKIPFKPFLVSSIVSVLLQKIRVCLSKNGGIDFEEFIPDIEAVRLNDNDLITSFLAFASSGKSIISVSFNDRAFKKLQNPDKEGFIAFAYASENAVFSDSHAMVSYGVGPEYNGKNTIDLINSWGYDWGVDATSRSQMPIKVGHLLINANTIKKHVQTILRLKLGKDPMSNAGIAAAAAAGERGGTATLIASPEDISDFLTRLTNEGIFHGGGPKSNPKPKPKKSKTKKRRNYKSKRRNNRKKSRRTRRTRRR